MANPFKAYDFRGVFGEDFTLEEIYRIGRCLSQLMQARKILVGRDSRVSSPAMAEALISGMVEAGCEVHYVGLATTPMIYYLTARYRYRASVQITASHNPKEYNGLKISRSGAMPVGLDSGLAELAQMIRHKPETTLQKGKLLDLDMKPEYLSFLRQYRPENDLRLAIDGSNGMAGLFIRDLMGNTPRYLFLEPDGSFPNHEANPLDENNIQALKQKILEDSCDLGVIFDGDADRVAFVDEKGQALSPDLMIAVLGHHFLRKEKGKVLVDIRTSKSVKEYLRPMGGSVITWKVGRAFATPKLKEIKGIYGGELAGHYYFRDFFYSDSGILAFLLILKVFQQFHAKGIPVSQVMSAIQKYFSSGEMNFRIEDKEAAMAAFCGYFNSKEKPVEAYDFDGYRCDYSSWWFNIRPSNTEPYLRLVIEADSQELLEEKKYQAINLLRSFS